jgi:hypothetical protein
MMQPVTNSVRRISFSALLPASTASVLLHFLELTPLLTVCPSTTAKSKKQRRLAAKKQRVYEARILASGDIEALAPKIPLQHQSINLPGSLEGGPEEIQLAATKRMELKKAMRKERKDKIKETNYLKTM